MKTAAIIGCGKPQVYVPGHKEGFAIAYAHAEGYRAAFADVALCAVDPVAENRDALAESFNIPPERRFATADLMYQSLVPDAASVCTWPALHAPLGIQACRAGVKALTVEKPLALDGFQIHELLGTAKQLKTRVAVAHQRRYEKPFELAQEIIQSGALGKNLVIEARVGEDWDILSWTVHWFDMANYFFDATPTSVLAGMDYQRHRRYGHAVEDGSVVFADYSENRQAVFVTGPNAIPHSGITVRGSAGMMTVGDPIELWTRDGFRSIKPIDKSGRPSFASLFTDLWQSVGNDYVSRCDITLTAPATQIAYAAHESARTMSRVSLPLRTWYAPLEVLEHKPVLEVASSRAGLRVALLADEHKCSDDSAMSGRKGLHDALIALGHDVTLLDAEQDLAPGALRDADVLVLYHTQQKTPASHRSEVGQWFESGKPVVVSHCGIGAYADWPEFRKWVGRFWVWTGEPLPPSRHPHVSCSLHTNDVRFDVPWTTAWLPIDEMYQQLGHAGEVTPLVTATAPDGTTEVYAYQVKANPNVVGWLPGHRADMFTLSAVRDGLQAAICMVTDTHPRRVAPVTNT